MLGWFSRSHPTLCFPLPWRGHRLLYPMSSTRRYHASPPNAEDYGTGKCLIVSGNFLTRMAQTPASALWRGNVQLGQCCGMSVPSEAANGLTAERQNEARCAPVSPNVFRRAWSRHLAGTTCVRRAVVRLGPSRSHMESEWNRVERAVPRRAVTTPRTSACGLRHFCE